MRGVPGPADPEGGGRLALLRELYRYNAAAREGYLRTFGTLPWEKMVEDRGASYGSLRDLFLHVLEAYEYWFDFVLTGRTDAWKDLDDTFPSFQSVRDLRARADAVGARVAAVVDGWTVAELRRGVRVPARSGVPSLNVETIALHLVEEELQHRGEMNALLWQMGTEAPILDFDDWWLSRRPPPGEAGPWTAKD